MAVSMGPVLCVDGMRVASAIKNSVFFPCDFMVLNSGQGNMRACGIIRVRRNMGEVTRRTRLLGQMDLHLREVLGGLILGGSKKSLFGKERFGRLCVSASRSEEERDLWSSQHMGVRNDLEGEEDGVDNEVRTGIKVSATFVYALHEENSIMPVLGPRRRFRSRFLGLVKLRTNIAEAAEGLFRSEIRRRFFVTIFLLMASRAGYFIPLPGFDRRSMPGDYLGFVSGAVEELGDAVSDIKLSVFQLGISPYVLSSILMQVFCHVGPALVTLRKECIDGNEKIKKYTWWLAFGVAVVESLGIAVHSIPYPVYAAQDRFGYLVVTTSLLAFGAVILNWICDKITEAGFGQGSSLIICIGILKGYSETLLKMSVNLQRGSTSWAPSTVVFLCVFLVITMWAVLVTEGRRKIKMVYYNFELAPTQVSQQMSYVYCITGAENRLGDVISNWHYRFSFGPNHGWKNALESKADVGLQEVEPYIPFDMNPIGMQPVLTTTYLMAVPSLVAKFQAPIEEHIRGVTPSLQNSGILQNPGKSVTWHITENATSLISPGFARSPSFEAKVDTPKEISEYLMKSGARVPKEKPGRQTIKYLTEVQQSSRFWGGILLAMLVTVSTIVDNSVRATHEGGSIGFTSMLIIVGSIIELRRSYMAYNVMPELSKILKRYGA